MKKKPVNKRSADYKAGKDDGYKLGYDDGLKALKEQLGNDWVYKMGYLEGVDAGREFQETAKALEKPTKGKPEPVDDVDDPELLEETHWAYQQGYIEGWVSCKAEVLNRIAKLDTKDELA